MPGRRLRLDELERARYNSAEKVEEFKARERETLRHNSRLLDEAIARDEREIDAQIARSVPWSDKWWRLLDSADKLRRRRIGLLEIMT